MSEEQGAVAVDEEVIDDWSKAGVTEAGPIALVIEASTPDTQEWSDGVSEITKISGTIVERRDADGGNPREANEKFFANISLEPSRIGQFKNLVDGLGMEVSGPVTRGALREMAEALTGQTVYTTVRHKQSQDGSKTYANLGFKFARSFEDLLG